MPFLKRPPQPPQPSADDRLLQAIVDFRHQASLALGVADREHRETLADAHERIAQARRWVAQSDVGESAVRLWRASKPWHAWVKREDWANWNTLQVTEVDGGGGKVGETWSAFTRGGTRWRFHHTSASNSFSDTPCLYGRLVTSVNGEDVLTVTTTHDVGEYSDWRWLDAEAITVGPWTVELTEMRAILEHEQKQRMAQFEADRIMAMANNMKL